MDKRKITTAMKSFDTAINVTEGEIEFWYARSLMELLGYEQWKNFEKEIQKAMESCVNVEIQVTDHFREVTKTVQ